MPLSLSAQESEGEETAQPQVTGNYKLELVVAKVNERVITSDRLCQRLFKMNGDQVLGQMITEMMIEDEAKAQNIEIDDKELEERLEVFKNSFPDENGYQNWAASQKMTEDDVKAQVKLNLMQEKLIITARELSVEDEEIEEFFETNKEQLGTPEQFKCSHILSETQEEAQEILIALEAGADFAKLATLKSKDTASAENGGDLGWLAAGGMPPEFAQVVPTLGVGETSNVIPTQFGFHVLKVEEKKDPVPAKLDKEMKKELGQFILGQKIQAAMPEYMRELQEKSEISVYPEISAGGEE
jgi:foldase protein PrsA